MPASIQDVLKAITLATAVKKLALKNQQQQQNRPSAAPSAPRAVQPTQSRAAPAAAIPADPFAGLDQNDPVVKDLIARGVITPGMDSAKLATLLQMGGLRGQIPIDIKALMDEINANYDKYTGDILTSGADWMKELYGNVAPGAEDPNAALFAQDPIFSSYAGGMAQIDETADVNRASDLAWFDKQQAAMQGYYDMLMQQVATAQPEVSGGGGGGGGGGRGYGGGGGGGSGDGDSEFTEGDWEKIKTAFKAVESAQRTGYENYAEDYPGYVRGIRNTFGAYNPEFAGFATDIMDTYGSDPERVAAALVAERDAALADLETGNQAMWGNELWEQGAPQMAELRLQSAENAMGGDNPATQDVVETDFLSAQQLAENSNPALDVRQAQDQALWAQAYDPSFIPGGLAGRDFVTGVSEGARKAAINRLLHPNATPFNSQIPPQVQSLMANATGNAPAVDPWANVNGQPGNNPDGVDYFDQDSLDYIYSVIGNPDLSDEQAAAWLRDPNQRMMLPQELMPEVNAWIQDNRPEMFYAGGNENDPTSTLSGPFEGNPDLNLGYNGPAQQDRQRVSALLQNALGGQNTGGIAQLIQNATGATSRPATGGGLLGSLGMDTAQNYFSAATSNPGLFNKFGEEDTNRIWGEGAIRDDGTIRQNLMDMLKEFSYEQSRQERNAALAQGEDYIPAGPGTYWDPDAPTQAEQDEIARKLQAIAQFRHMNDLFNRGIGMVNFGNRVTDRTQESQSLTTTAQNETPPAAALLGIGDINAEEAIDSDYMDVIPGNDTLMDENLGLGAPPGTNFNDPKFSGRVTTTRNFMDNANLVNEAIKRLAQPKPVTYTPQSLGTSVKKLAQNRVVRQPTNPEMDKIRKLLSGVKKNFG